MQFHLQNHKKKILSAVLSGVVLTSAGAPVLAYNTDNSTSIISSIFQNAAKNETDLSMSGYALQRLGLISGSEDGDLMLEKAGTRQEGFTLFLALLGEQDKANATQYSYTFTDVADWFGNYAGYGVYQHYTSGLSEKHFGAQDAITAQQYMAFVLRALGYTDFNWTESINKAVEIGLCTQQQADHWTNDTFRRQELMEISYLALSARMRGSESTLADKLIAAGRITEQQAEAEGLTYGTAYTAPADTGSTKVTAYDAMPEGNYELHNLSTNKIMSTTTTKQADVVMSDDINSSNQTFTILGNADGTFRIASSNDYSLMLDTNPTDGADAIMWAENGSDCQNFAAEEVSEGVYIIRLASNANVALTAVNGDVRLSTYTGTAEQQWTLNSNQEDMQMASEKLASIMTVYPSGKKLGSSYSFAGARQCMGFGREVFYRMYGETARWSYDGSPKSSADAALYTIVAKSNSYSADSMRALISKAKPGDILQMNTPKMHTMVFVSSDDTGFTVYDANWVSSNQVSVRRVSYGAWSGRNSSSITLLHATNYPTK
ncbi:MAG: RICIN domain-containing protein [Eubacteriales bacterium]|nr:RICIN domain-containing protein [Eubacteriales bacterium]